MMEQIHKELSRQYRWYKKWHQMKDAGKVHWVVLVLTGSVIAASVLTIVDNTQFVVDLNTSLASSRANEILQSLPARAQAATAVAYGHVASINSGYETNSFGDRLIVTHVRFQVDEQLRGHTSPAVDLDMVGGTVNGITMRSSMEPEPLGVGQSAVVFLRQKNNGHYLISGDSQGAQMGLMRLNSSNQTEEGLSLDQIRAAIGGVR